MRKLLATICFLLVFFSQAGYYGIFAIEQAIIREEQKHKMLSQLDDATLETIPQQPGMHFIEGGREFYLHGELYDVVRTKTVDGKKLYLALNDEKESVLMKKLGDTGKDNSNDAKKGSLKFATIFMEPVEDLSLPTLAPSAIHLSIVQENLLARQGDITPPPPDQA